MNSTQMQIVKGDFVQLYDPSSDQELIGKIQEIRDNYFLYFKYLKPDQAPGGRQSHHSDFELIRTDEQSKEFTDNVRAVVKVMRLVDYKEKYPKK